MKSLLAVRIDGTELSPEEARSLWQEFSAHLDEHTLDFAGFAKKKGWASIKPEHRAGRALLVVDSGQAPKPQAPKPQSPKPQAPKPQSPKPQAPKPQAPKPQSPTPKRADPQRPGAQRPQRKKPS